MARKELNSSGHSYALSQFNFVMFDSVANFSCLPELKHNLVSVTYHKQTESFLIPNRSHKNNFGRNNFFYLLHLTKCWRSPSDLQSNFSLDFCLIQNILQQRSNFFKSLAFIKLLCSGVVGPLVVGPLVVICLKRLLCWVIPIQQELKYHFCISFGGKCICARILTKETVLVFQCKKALGRGAGFHGFCCRFFGLKLSILTCLWAFQIISVRKQIIKNTVSEKRFLLQKETEAVHCRNQR